MATDPPRHDLPAWLKNAPASDEAHIYIAVGSEAELSQNVRDALETLARELAQADTTGHMMMTRCPCQLPKSLWVCRGNRCMVHLTGTDR